MFRKQELLENPPTARSQAAARAPTTRSKATNKPRKQVLSGNTTQGRRLLDLADAYAAALGGWSKLTEMQAASVRAAAELTVLAEEARHNALRNGCGDPDQWAQSLVLCAGLASTTAGANRWYRRSKKPTWRRRRR